MYHPKIIAESRERVERALRMPLREYSWTEVEDFSRRMRDIEWAEDGSPSRPLTEEEARYVFNETQMSRISFDYWVRRYCKILTDDKYLRPLVPWPSQQLLFDAIAEEEIAEHQNPERRKIRIILLKSRQVGGTAGAEALVAHMVFLNSKTQGLIASDHPDNSLNLWQTLLRMYDHMPGWMKPHKEGRVKGQRLTLDRLMSDVVVGAGNQKTTLGQGMNVDVAHLTEVSTWIPEMSIAIDEDLFPAFNSSQKHHSLIVLESTGHGAKGNWFHDQYQSALEGTSLFRPIFVAWYHRPGWVAKADGITFTEQTLNMAKRVRQETGAELSREQLAFYQLQRRELEVKGMLEVFFQEYPSTVEEAFQTGMRSVFPIELRSKLRDSVRRPVAVFDVTPGETKPLKVLNLEEWIREPDKRKGQPHKADGRLIIWEYAKPGYTYVVGVDASHGLEGGDSTALTVLRVGNKWLGDEQVAEYRGIISPYDLSHVVEMVGNIYKDRMEDFPAKLAIESNPGSPGLVTQIELQKRGYPNFYVWRRPTSISGGWTREYGWWTTTSTRPILMANGEEYVRKGWVQINSPYLIEEMATFVNTGLEKGKKHWEHAPGCYDDRILALFIAITVAHQDEQRLVAEDRRRAREQALAPPEKIIEFNTTGMGWDEAMAAWEKSLA